MPQRLRALEAELRDLARAFVQDVAIWYPLRVIMRILGVPPDDEALMLMLTQDIFGPDDPNIRQAARAPTSPPRSKTLPTTLRG